jgi:hypothetical protein
VRPYTYRCGTSDLRQKLAEVSPDDVEYGLHGIRVQAYNDAKEAAGEDIAVAQGGWQPGGAHTRYDRFDLRRDIFPLAARMLGAHPIVGQPETGANFSPPARPVVRYPAPRSALADVVAGMAPRQVTVDGQPAVEVDDDADAASMSAHASLLSDSEEEGAGSAIDATFARTDAHVAFARRLAAAHGNSSSPPARPPSPTRAVTRSATRARPRARS